MQRSKIKVGAEYAVSNHRDWWTYGIQFVQVLDVGRWRIIHRLDEAVRAGDPDEVQNPHMKPGFTIQVPGHIRRDDGRRYRSSNTLVLVRYVTASEDGETEYGKVTLVETRNLVAERAEGERRVEEHRALRNEKTRQAQEERDRRREQEKSLNERLASFGAGPVGQAYSGSDRWALAAADLEMLLTLAERPRHCAVTPESPDETCPVCGDSLDRSS